MWFIHCFRIVINLGFLTDTKMFGGDLLSLFSIESNRKSRVYILLPESWLRSSSDTVFPTHTMKKPKEIFVTWENYVKSKSWPKLGNFWQFCSGKMILYQTIHILDQTIHILDQPIHVLDQTIHLLDQQIHVFDQPIHILDQSIHIYTLSTNPFIRSSNPFTWSINPVSW